MLMEPQVKEEQKSGAEVVVADIAVAVAAAAGIVADVVAVVDAAAVAVVAAVAVAAAAAVVAVVAAVAVAAPVVFVVAVVVAVAVEKKHDLASQVGLCHQLNLLASSPKECLNLTFRLEKRTLL